MWRRGRGRFARRIALIFAVMLFFNVFGVVSLLSAIVRRRGFGGTNADAEIVLAVMSGIVVFGLLFTILRRVGLPLGTIVEAANRVAEGDFSTRVAEQGPPSLRTVGRAFNTMAARLEAQDLQRRNLMADIAHELRTPLTVIQGRLEGLLDGVYPRDDAGMEQLLEETRLLSRLVDDLRTLASVESGTLTLQKEPTDLAMLAQDVVAVFATEGGRRQVTVRLDAPRDVPMIALDPLRIREVIANLLSNALRHTPSGGAVSVTLKQLDRRVLLSVADTGSGIEARDLPKIFDRFYKGAGSRGSGLGLTIARNLVSAHGGEIRAESQVGKGTTITITLPSTDLTTTG
jgi:signal transduction histidine kinase